jgi:hypothetical protein
VPVSGALSEMDNRQSRALNSQFPGTSDGYRPVPYPWTPRLLSTPIFSKFIPGAKQVDGEIIETLWAPLNNISRSLRGMSLAHRQEVLDAPINHSNRKKLIWISISHLFQTSTYISLHLIVPSHLKRWKRLELGFDPSAQAYKALSKHFADKTQKWLEEDNDAQAS